MDWSAYVGLPWQDRGRGRPGYDCYGLFRLAFEAGTGIALPSHDDAYVSVEDHAETSAILAGDLGDWIDVTDSNVQRPFDAVVMRIMGGPHIGIIVRPGQMLHMPHGSSSMMDRLRYRAHIFRHKRLA